MKKNYREKEDKYEITIKKFGSSDPLETDIMGDSETREILHLIGKLNLRSAFCGLNEGCCGG